MTVTMKATRIHVFGGPEVILFEEVPRPTPGTGEVLVRVHAAGVGPWDAQGIFEERPATEEEIRAASLQFVASSAGLTVRRKPTA